LVTGDGAFTSEEEVIASLKALDVAEKGEFFCGALWVEGEIL
jgi:hypothetical protein